MKQNRILKPAFAILVLMLLLPAAAFSRARIPAGERDVINVVYETPKEDSIEIDGRHLDIGCFYREYNIGYILPLYVVKEPVLVYYDKESESYYEPTTPEQKAVLKAYLKEKKLDEASLLHLNFYTRYGGKVVALIILALIVYGAIGEIKKKVTKIKEL